MTVGAHATGLFYKLIRPSGNHYFVKIMYENGYIFNKVCSHDSDIEPPFFGAKAVAHGHSPEDLIAAESLADLDPEWGDNLIKAPMLLSMVHADLSGTQR